MATKLVIWVMEIEADDDRSAAREALTIQRDPESLATEFYVMPSDKDTNKYLDVLCEEATLVDLDDEERPDEEEAAAQAYRDGQNG